MRGIRISSVSHGIRDQANNKNGFWDQNSYHFWNQSASVSSGVPNTEKQMKAPGRRPSAFIVSRCLEPPMKHEARVSGKAS